MGPRMEQNIDDFLSQMSNEVKQSGVSQLTPEEIKMSVQYGLQILPVTIYEDDNLTLSNLRNDIARVSNSTIHGINISSLYYFADTSTNWLKSLTTLDLSRSQLSLIPPLINQLLHLEELYLDSNELTFVPSELLKLKKLHTLSLGFNPLTSIPVELIGKMENLSWLYISRDQLSLIPTDLNQIKYPNVLEMPPELGLVEKYASGL